MYHAPISKGFFLPWLTFHLWAEKIRFFWLRACLVKKKLDFQVLHSASSPRRRCKSSHGRWLLRLGKGKAHLGVRVHLSMGMPA